VKTHNLSSISLVCQTSNLGPIQKTKDRQDNKQSQRQETHL